MVSTSGLEETDQDLVVTDEFEKETASDFNALTLEYRRRGEVR